MTPLHLRELEVLTESLNLRDEYLRMSEQQFRGFAEYFPAPAWLKNGQGILLWQNSASAAAFPMVRVGEDARHWFDPALAMALAQQDADVLSVGAPLQFVCTILTNSYIITRFPIPFGGETCIGGIAFDLTDILALLSTQHDSIRHPHGQRTA